MFVSQWLSTLEYGGAAWFAVAVVAILVTTVGSYLLGSVNFAVIFSEAIYHDDVRNHGSGNAGGTNMLRTYGGKAAALTLVCDMAKAGVAVALGYFFFPFFVGDGSMAIAGFFAVLGHCFPVFFRFHGGKGVASVAVVVCLISPPTFLILITLFILILLLTRYVSLGSVMGMFMFPYVYHRVEAWFLESAFKAGRVTETQAMYITQSNAVATIFSVLIAALIIFMHRENIHRLRMGTESKTTFHKKGA